MKSLSEGCIPEKYIDLRYSDSELRESLVEKIVEEVIKPENEHRFPNYRKMYRDLLKWLLP